MKRIALGLLLAATFATAAVPQPRPPAQKTGPITIYGDGSTGPISDMTVKAPGVPGGQKLSDWFTSPVFNGKTVVDPMGLRQGPRGDPGNRGPMFIWNNPIANSPAGQSAGFQVWIGDNPTATPGANDTVAGTISVVNGKNRQQLWGMDILTGVCNASLCGPDYLDAATRVLELEVNNGYPMTEPNPWGSGFRKNGIEMTGREGGGGRLTSAFMTWANDNTGNLWWNTGLALSRIYDVGILAQANPSGTVPGPSSFNADATSAFKTAFIYDLSDSRSVLKVGPGNHNSVIDMSNSVNPGYLVFGRQDRDSSYTLGNASDFNFGLTIDSGLSAQKQGFLSFSDRGSIKWQTGKQSDNSYIFFDATGGTVPLQMYPGATGGAAATVALTGNVIETNSSTPAGPGAQCTRGQHAWDANYEYRCVAANTWKRAALATW